MAEQNGNGHGQEEHVEHFPLDFDAIQKGDVIPTEKVEEYSGINRSSERFAIALLNFSERVYDECRHRGKHFSIVVRKKQIRVLTDPEAAEHEARMVKRHLKGSRRNYRKLCKVDVSNLDESHRTTFEHDVLRLGKVIAAQRSAYKKHLTAEPHQSTLPGLPSNAAS